MRAMKSSLKHHILLLLLAVTCLHAGAQDFMPAGAQPDVQGKTSYPVKPIKLTPDTIAVRFKAPHTFKSVGENRIEEYGDVLSPILKRLYLLHAGASHDTLRIVHVGDSHVRGRIYPQTVGEKLVEAFSDIHYTDMGVNGATCLTFTHPARIEAIAELKPELLILSFGTNESHNRRYNAAIHYHQIDELVTLLQARMPGVPILLTTPPGQYESFRQSRRRRTYTVNPRTPAAVRTIRQYAQEKQLALWDVYTFLGGKENAAKNWWNAGLMRPDHIHFMPEGYVLQGELLYEALINAYNNYVAN